VRFTLVEDDEIDPQVEGLTMDLDTLTANFLDHLAARNRFRFDLEGLDGLDALSGESNHHRGRSANRTRRPRAR
jgi:hypothetical protein